MNIMRGLLRPVAFLAGVHASRQLEAFRAACGRAADVQDRLLAELVSRHAETHFGLDHNFAAIRSYDDFRSAVPVGDYETHRPYMAKVLAGQTEALLPPGEEVLMFSQTSGTTGLPKHIPVTRRFLADMRRGWNIFGLHALRDHPRAWLRSILQISSSMCESTSPTGLPCGAISGLLAATQMKIVRRMYPAPAQAADIRDPAAKYYTLLRCAVGADVAIITTANPSSTLKLIQTGQAHAERLIRDVADGSFRPPGELPAGLAGRLRLRPDRPLARRLEQGIARDGRLLPRHFWNLELLCNWTGGTLQLYRRRLSELFGDVPVRDIGLLASEGRFSIPLADGTPAGAAEITANFLEFIPAESARRDVHETLRAHQLDVGAEYFLVLTNGAGLWRYNLDDRVRVTAHLGQCPVFEFLSRGPHTANITGEKLTEHQVVEAMRRAAGELDAAVECFTLQGCFAPTPYYELRVEACDGWSADALAERMDAALAALNVEYQSKRSGGRLGPIRAATVEPGFFRRQEEHNIRLRHGRGEQYKHQYLLATVRDEDRG